MRDSPYLSPILCKLAAGEPLDPIEQRRMGIHYGLAWSILYSEWVQSQLDLVGEYSPDFDVALEISLRIPGMAERFEESGVRIYPAPFGSHVEKLRRRIAQD